MLREKAQFLCKLKTIKEEDSFNVHLGTESESESDESAPI